MVALRRWARHDRCADDSPVHYLERLADPHKVVLYFEGGGACFSAATCAFDGPDTSYVAASEFTANSMADRGGIFDFEQPENPLADYSFVYVPYCTGDGHLGSQTTTYADDLTVEHRGYANGLAALDHLVATYPDVGDLLVTGVSAGSIPTPLYAGLAADRLPQARIVTLGDGSGAYPSDPVLNAFIGSLWGTDGAIPTGRRRRASPSATGGSPTCIAMLGGTRRRSPSPASTSPTMRPSHAMRAWSAWPPTTCWG